VQGDWLTGESVTQLEAKLKPESMANISVGYLAIRRSVRVLPPTEVPEASDVLQSNVSPFAR